MQKNIVCIIKSKKKKVENTIDAKRNDAWGISYPGLNIKENVNNGLRRKNWNIQNIEQFQYQLLGARWNENPDKNISSFMVQ